VLKHAMLACSRLCGSDSRRVAADAIIRRGGHSSGDSGPCANSIIPHAPSILLLLMMRAMYTRLNIVGLPALQENA